MSQAHSILATALLCAAASACAANTSHAPVRTTYARSTQPPREPLQVRNMDGDPLPTYALTDAGAYIEVECRNGQVYQIVDRSQDFYSPSLLETLSGYRGLDGICDRVRGSRLDYGHLH